MKSSDIARIGALVKAKRRKTKLGLRAAAAECGISPSTLSRLERGDSSSLPDADTLTKLAAWLNVTVAALLSEKLKPTADPELTTPEVVEVHLRADKRLSTDTASALGRAFRLLYDQLAKEPGEQKRDG
jgi:transcriptional regulator with XRE-family HTH domain